MFLRSQVSFYVVAKTGVQTLSLDKFEYEEIAGFLTLTIDKGYRSWPLVLITHATSKHGGLGGRFLRVFTAAPPTSA